MIDFITGIDRKIALFLNEYFIFKPGLWFFNFFTVIGTAAAVWVLIFIVFSVFRKEKWTWLYWIIPFAVVFLAVELGLKNIIARERPYTALDGITMLALKPHSFSLPSAHSAFSAAAVVIISRLKIPPSIVWFILLSVLISVSRIILKVHFMSDVVCGYALGLLIAFFVIKLLDKIREKSTLDSLD